MSVATGSLATVRLGVVARGAATGIALVVAPIAWYFLILRAPGVGWDFRVFYDAGRSYLDGRSPYPDASLAGVAAKNVFVYPAPAAAAMAPLALLPYGFAFGSWIAASLGAVALALHLLGVRDWRCYGAAFSAAPVVLAVGLGTLEPALVLLLAVLWRYRDRWLVAAAAAAALVVAKLFLWPVLVWLLCARRSRAAVAAAIAASLATALAWLPLGLASAERYPDVLHTLSQYERTFSFSPTSLALAAGAGSRDAALLAVLIGIAALMGVIAAARRDDQLSFRLALASAFVLSPIVWGHYWALLLVPLALRRPRLSPVWFAAAWIPADSLFWHHLPALWIGAALGVAALQLGLAPRLRLPASVGAAAVAAMSFAAFATADHTLPRLASLAPTAGAASGHAEAMLRVAGGELCWIVWTEHVPTRAHASATLTSPAGILPLTGFSLTRDGGARGCARSGHRQLAGMLAHSDSYRLSLRLGPGRGALEGPLRKQELRR